MSSRAALYTDWDDSCCHVLRARVADGGLPAGDVLCADVRSLDERTLARYAQVHLFAGLGGSPLGFRWAGWPPGWSLVTGGFPCQDISSAGKGAGLEGSRSGLFWELMRVAEIKRPVGLFCENVGALSARGLDRVVGALESLGYWVEALRVGSWAIGAPDQRERWWFVCVRSDGAGSEVENCRSTRVADQLPQAGGQRREPSSIDGAEAVRQVHGEAGTKGATAGSRDGGSDQRRVVADVPGVRCEPGPGEQGDEGRAGRGRDQPDSSRPRRELADVGGDGQGAERVGRAGAEPNQPGAGGELADQHSHGRWINESGREAGSRGIAGWAGEECRWPHPRWYVLEPGPGGRLIEKTVPTPQHEWEPPRLYPGTRTVNARWRLALMGYPLEWLDVDLAVAAAGKRSPERWWNKQGVAMTGNAQNPRVVAVLARAMVESMRKAVAA